LQVRVFYHDKCFDGACSAALFSRFYKERIRSEVEYEYSGLLHRAGALFDENKFDGTRMPSSISNTPVRQESHGGLITTKVLSSHQPMPLTSSRTRAIKILRSRFQIVHQLHAMIAEQRFGFDPRPVTELVRWADIVDGAMYDDPKSAVEMQAPAMKLTMAIEASTEHDFVKRLIRLLAYSPSPKYLRNPSWLQCCRRSSSAIMLPSISCASAQKKKTVPFFSTSPTSISKATTSSFLLSPSRFRHSIGVSKSSFRVKVSVGRIRGQSESLPSIWQKYANVTVEEATLGRRHLLRRHSK